MYTDFVMIHLWHREDILTDLISITYTFPNDNIHSLYKVDQANILGFPPKKSKRLSFYM